jgi:hypothetical protein
MPLRRESLTHSERAQRGRIGAYVMHARHDARSTTAAARQAFDRRFLDLVDPDRSLPESERLRRAEAARRAYFVQLAYRSALARRRARRRSEGAG